VEVVLEPQPLTADAWAPFGWVPVADTDSADGQGRRYAEDNAGVDPGVQLGIRTVVRIPR